MLQIQNLTAGYTKQQATLQNISFAVERGSFCTILGANGSGKTTFIRAVMGLMTYQQGEILFEGQPLETRQRRQLAQQISVLSQEQPVNMDFSVEEIVQLGRFPFQKQFFNENSKKDAQIVLNCMEMTNIVEMRHRFFSSLSGGERQRVLLAKALAQQPKLLFLDEPTNHLDIKYTIELLKLLKQQQLEKGLTVIAILHDLNLAALYSDQLVFLKKGELIAEGSVELLLDEQLLERVYDVSLQVATNDKTGKPMVFYQ